MIGHKCQLQMNHIQIRHPIVVAISGASGSIYAWRTVKALLEAGCKVELIQSPAAKMVMKDELKFERGEKFIDFLWRQLEKEVDRSQLIELSHNGCHGFYEAFVLPKSELD